ncbi:MAG: hypothetical protein JO112_07320 [Planctomycetes bacterium]|nr:hypothetical protein [Planctomycetota bacterium]
MIDQPPAWVYKRDGRRVPFEADKISRALFAATETLGQPDAFVARELTDGVLHFLSAEADHDPLTTTQVADLVIKVVRELGQPALSQVFEEFGRRRALTGPKSAPCESKQAVAGPDQAILQEIASLLDNPSAASDPRGLLWRTGEVSLGSYALREVFARDLVAAHQDGLLTLPGREAPLELAALVLGQEEPRRKELVETLEEARRWAGNLVALDGPEYGWFAPASDQGAVSFLRELGIGLRATGLKGVLNLNSASVPPWAEELGEGPLFAGQRSSLAADQASARAALLRDRLFLPGARWDNLRLDWHLGERDWLPGKEDQLLPLARRAAEGAPVSFVFDRLRRPVNLAEGLDRRHPTLLLRVGLHLPRFAQQPGLRSDPDLFLHKLGSLARLALSAAVQKRAFLKRYPRAWTGFLLDRARLIVVPVGLETVVQEVVGQGLCVGGAGLDFGRRIVQRLREVLETDGQACRVDTAVDSAPNFFLPRAAEDQAASSSSNSWVAGLTTWDAEASPRQQLRAAGLLHAAADLGTAAVLVPQEKPLVGEELVDLLRYAWHHTQVVRLRWLRVGPPPRQLVAPWEEAGP